MRLSRPMMSSALFRITEQEFVSRQAGNETMLLILKDREMTTVHRHYRALKIVHFINSKGTFFNMSALGDILQLLLILPEQCASWTITAEQHSERP